MSVRVMRRKEWQVPDDAVVVVDGLAFGAMPDEAWAERDRLRLVALVHHPLGLETGLPAPVSEQLLASERRALQAARGVVVTSKRGDSPMASARVHAASIRSRPAVRARRIKPRQER